MTEPVGALLVGAGLLGALLAVGMAAGARAMSLRDLLLGLGPEGRAGAGQRRHGLTASVPLALSRAGVPAACLVLGAAGLALGRVVAPPVGGLVGLLAGACAPVMVRARWRRARTEVVERQLGEVAESTALAVRSGLSVRQALEFAAGEVSDPMAGLVRQALDRHGLGVPLEEAVWGLAQAVDPDAARLVALILGIHGRSGGNLGGALGEVSATIRHRIGVRRELRALSAQGRISGGILGFLPVGFSLVLSATSRQDLQPVYRTRAGMAMVSVGLAMQAAAYLWIRRLLRVEV